MCCSLSRPFVLWGFFHPTSPVSFANSHTKGTAFPRPSFGLVCFLFIIIKSVCYLFAFLKTIRQSKTKPIKLTLHGLEFLDKSVVETHNGLIQPGGLRWGECGDRACDVCCWDHGLDVEKHHQRRGLTTECLGGSDSHRLVEGGEVLRCREKLCSAP